MRYNQLLDRYEREKNEKHRTKEELKRLLKRIPFKERVAIEEGRKQVLASLMIDTISDQVKNLKVIGLSNREGTVHLVINGGSQVGLVPGMRLEVCTKSADEVWGVIELREVEDHRSFGFRVDRVNPEFWESLENRMKYDSSPPKDIALEPFIIDEVKGLFASGYRILKTKGGEEIDVTAQ